jgi:hypothetical protein
VKIAHFVGMDSDELEGPVNEFLAVNGEGVINILYQTTLIPAEGAVEFQEVEYSVVIVYREDAV